MRQWSPSAHHRLGLIARLAPTAGRPGLHRRRANVARMRTAVVPVNVDPSGLLTPAQLDQGMSTLLGLAAEVGAEVLQAPLGGMPAPRREVQLLISGSDADAVKQSGLD